MEQLTLSCPACAQPAEAADRYCERCGADLRAGQGTDRSPAGPGPAAAAARPTAPAAAAPTSGGPAERPPAGVPGPSDPRTAAPGPAPDRAAHGASDHGSTGDFVIAAPARVLVDGREAAADRSSPSAPGRDGGGQHAEGMPPGSGAGPATAESAEARLCEGCGAHATDADARCRECGRALPHPRDHQERALESIAGVSDRGHRHHRNEDAFTVAATSRPDGSPAVVAVVCDGVSSAARPDDASRTAADAASEYLLEALEAGTEAEPAMRGAIMDAGEAVVGLAGQGPSEPGRNSPACTCVSAVAVDGRFTIGWVGDSRAYWIPDEDRAGGAERLTVDDSWAARMVEAGLMDEAEAFADPRAHAITGWLGADAVDLEPHTLCFVPPAAGVVLICTDGLWNYAESAADMAAAVPRDARLRPLQAARSLVRFALDNGGHDNVTVAVLPWLPPVAAPPPPPPSTEAALPVQPRAVR